MVIKIFALCSNKVTVPRFLLSTMYSAAVTACTNIIGKNNKGIKKMQTNVKQNAYFGDEN